MFLTGVKSFLVHYLLPPGLLGVFCHYSGLWRNAPWLFVGLAFFATGASVYVTCGYFGMPFWIARSTRIVDGEVAARKYPFIYFLAGVASIVFSKFA